MQLNERKKRTTDDLNRAINTLKYTARQLETDKINKQIHLKENCLDLYSLISDVRASPDHCELLTSHTPVRFMYLFFSLRQCDYHC